jgi:hypothetical protein
MNDLIKITKPILFNTEDVKAILDGKKNKTARVFSKTQLKYFDYAQKLGEMSSLDNLHEDDFAYILQFSQYKVGDILYVKEKCVDEYPNGFCFKEDYEEEEWNDRYLIKQYCNKLNARIFLKVTNVRAERLQDIRVRDIEKETGWKREIYSYSNYNKAFYRDYCDLWNSISKDGYKWENNPYVFVYEFERVYDV